MTLLQGDCLELMAGIPDGSVDMVLADPPYGVMGKSTHDLKGWKNRNIQWDKTLPPNAFLPECARILRPNGKCILFSSDPYTTQLISLAPKSMPFSYRAIWLKNNAGNVLGCKKNLVSYFEDILIFSKNSGFAFYDFDGTNPLRDWFRAEFKRAGISSRRCKEILGNQMYSHYCTDGIQFCIPTEENYIRLQNTGFFNRPYEEIKKQNDEWNLQHKLEREAYYHQMNGRYPSVFNLWDGAKTKSNVFYYKKESQRFHPTQKPVLLLEDLIKTYTNEGEVVLDACMGSGSTGVACINTGRDFIGIELDPGYFETARRRIEEAEIPLRTTHKRFGTS